MINNFKEKYGDNPSEVYVDNRARKIPTNPFFGLLRNEGEEEGEAGEELESILVQDKNDPARCSSILDYSLPIKENLLKFETDSNEGETTFCFIPVAYDNAIQSIRHIFENFDLIYTYGRGSAKKEINL